MKFKVGNVIYTSQLPDEYLVIRAENNAYDLQNMLTNVRLFGRDVNIIDANYSLISTASIQTPQPPRNKYNPGDRLERIKGNPKRIGLYYIVKSSRFLGGRLSYSLSREIDAYVSAGYSETDLDSNFKVISKGISTQQPTQINLNPLDFAAFEAALNSPTQPNDILKAAAVKYGSNSRGECNCGQANSPQGHAVFCNYLTDIEFKQRYKV